MRINAAQRNGVSLMARRKKTIIEEGPPQSVISEVVSDERPTGDNLRREEEIQNFVESFGPGVGQSLDLQFSSFAQAQGAGSKILQTDRKTDTVECSIQAGRAKPLRLVELARIELATS
jgi:hypothetical protein